MKELLKKGDAAVPKRSQSNAVSNMAGIQKQQPATDRQMSIGAASFKAAGFVSYDSATPAKDSGA